MNWRCMLGHDWVPYQPPRFASFSVETPCQCRRCGEASIIVEIFSDKIARKWAAKRASENRPGGALDA